MPIREFKCKNCGHEFEFIKIKSEDRVQCPECGEEREDELEVKFPSKGSFQLKGRGWYKDGY